MPFASGSLDEQKPARHLERSGSQRSGGEGCALCMSQSLKCLAGRKNCWHCPERNVEVPVFYTNDRRFIVVVQTTSSP